MKGESKAARLSGPQAATKAPAAAGDSTSAPGAGRQWRQTVQPHIRGLHPLLEGRRDRRSSPDLGAPQKTKEQTEKSALFVFYGIYAQ